MDQTERPTTLLGLGLYSIPRAAKILHIPAQKLRRWANGYTFRLEDAARHMDPVLVRELGDLHREGVITFRDLIELLFVSQFRQEGVSLSVIRAAARRARDLLGVSHPFAAQSFATDGKAIFGDLLQREGMGLAERPPANMTRVRFTEEVHTGQRVFTEFVEPYLRKHIYFDEGSASHYCPPEGRNLIRLDPNRRFGRPIVASVGIETEILDGCARAYGSPKAAADWYEVPLGAVKAAVAYERALRAA